MACKRYLPFVPDELPELLQMLLNFEANHQT
jgi:hypothetical protein